MSMKSKHGKTWKGRGRKLVAKEYVAKRYKNKDGVTVEIMKGEPPLTPAQKAKKTRDAKKRRQAKHEASLVGQQGKRTKRRRRDEYGNWVTTEELIK